MSIRKGNSVLASAPLIDAEPTQGSTSAVSSGGTYSAIQAVKASVEDIEALIPTQASASNQLADKAFVNSSLSTGTGSFIGTFNSVADLEAYSGTLVNGDYAFVVTTDQIGNTVYNRYKYTTATTPASWVFEYALNNSSFTANQWAAINSNATQELIAKISTNEQNISAHTANRSNPHEVTKAQIGLGNVDNTSDINKPVSTAVQNALDLKANTADLGTMATESASDYTKTANLALVATSGDYDDLSNKPTIPAAQVNADWNANSGVAEILNKPTLGTAAAAATTDFATAAQGAKADTALQPGDNISGLTNDAGYVTSASLPKEIEWATYGTTTYQEVSDWLDAGKMVFCYYDRNPDTPASSPHVYTAVYKNSLAIMFTSLETGASSWQTALEWLYVGKPNSISPGWHRGQTRLQNELPAGTSGQVLTYTGTAGVIGSAALSTVATSGDYTDLTNTPTIPTVNDATITITQGGVTKGSFTLNQASGDTIALDAGGGSGLPSQTGNAGKFLTTDGTDASWATPPASGILLEYKEFDHDPNDPHWVKPTMTTYLSASQYPEAHAYLYNEWMTPNTSANYYAWTNGNTTIYTDTATPTTRDSWWDINTNPTSTYPIAMQTYLIVPAYGSVIDDVAADYSTIDDINGVTYTRDAAKDIDAIRTFETETIAGITISYFNSVHGLKMVDMGQNTSGVYDATGDAWYYGISVAAAGTTFMLPVRKIRKLVRAGGTASKWYRLYSDGWVEQGGVSYVAALGQQIDLPITMDGTSYTLTLGGRDPSGDAGIVAYAYRTKNAGNFIADAGFNGTFYPGDLGWQVSGQSTVTPKGSDYYFYVK